MQQPRSSSQHSPVVSLGVSARTAGTRPITTADLPLERPLRVRGAYLHLPFCFHKCHYCDFYSLVDTRDRQEAFVDRLIVELGEFAVASSGVPLNTIFVGGGTPTLLRVDLWRRLLPVIRRCLPLFEGAEFTVEANPETVTDELAALLVDGGVNRVSVGAQSFNPRHLKTLERWHEPGNVAKSLASFRKAGITNLNLDLIFAIPGQSIEDWDADLQEVLRLAPTHISCYGLTYEPNTPMTAKLKAGRFARAEEDLEAAMFERTMSRLAAAGYRHYEVSNWALPGFECRHNLQYWNNADWWAFGPSASGHVQGVRWKNVPRIGDYLASPPTPIVNIERLDSDARVGERLMLGLRLLEGITETELSRILADDRSSRLCTIERHVLDGLLEWNERRLRLTARGLMIADTVIGDLV